MSQPNTAIVLEPSIRAFQDWTPQLIRGAEQIADGGTLRAAADLCDAMMADDRLLAVLNKRVHGVLGLEVTFEASRGKRRPVNALDIGEDWWAMFPEEDLGDVGKWGTQLGIGYGRLNWEPREGRVVGVLEPWHPRNLTWNWNKRQWFARVDGGLDVPVTPGDGNWILYTPYGRKRPWAKGLWRGLSRWWLLKQYAIYDWATYSERHGQGVFAAVPHQGTAPGKEDRKQLAADMQGMARKAAIAMPPGYDLKLVEAVANNWQTFKAQQDAANAAFAITVLGNNLSTEVTGGSFAAADVHKVVEATVLRFTAETLATCTHDQALTWWAEFNFGNKALAPWPHWSVEPPEDLQSSAQLWVTVGTAFDAFAKYKIPVDVEEVCSRFKIPLVVGAPIPKTLEAPPPPPNPFAPPPPSGDGGDGGDSGGSNDGGDSGDEPPADGEDQGGDQGGDGGDQKPPPKKKARARARAKAKSKGAADGQKYADNLADAARDRARAALKPDVAAILHAIDAGEDLHDIKDRLAKAYQSMNPAKLSKVTAAAMAMGELAGRVALKQDT